MIQAVSAALLISLTKASSEWSYNDQSQQWSDSYGSCGGDRQSPINIEAGSATLSSIEDDVDAPGIIAAINAMTFEATMSDPTHGHAIKFTPVVNAENSEVKCEQFHFHMDTSEHTVDGKPYFGEIHAVCYKNRNADFTAAVAEGKSDSLAVFGFFLEKSADDSSDANVQTIIDLVSSNPTGSDSVTVKLPTASSLSKYYRYMGGLTTPGCNEIVEWTVFADTVKISQAQIDSINGWNGHLIKNNRKTLPLGERKVTFFEIPGESSNESTDEPSEPGMSRTMMIGVAVVAIALLVGLFVFMKRWAKTVSNRAPEADAEEQPLK